jgi:hypothetical protein
MITLTWKTSVLASAIHAAKTLLKPVISDSVQPMYGREVPSDRNLPPISGASNTRDPLLLLPMHDLDSRAVFIDSAAALTANFCARRDSSAGFAWHRVLEQACSSPPEELRKTNTEADWELFKRLEASYRTMYPKIDEQLLLRARPIQESWTGFGRGLMAHVKRLTEQDWIVRDATCILVQPIRAGDGIAFPDSQCFLLEAMLTNASPDLPEVLRVAWLASQMGAVKLVDLGELTPAEQSRSLSVAMMMCTLAAGEVMELCRCDEATAMKAFQLWDIALGEPASVMQETRMRDAAKTAINWWETYLQTRPTIGVSVVALHKMLERIDS